MNDDHDMMPIVLQSCMNSLAAAGRRWANERLGGLGDMRAEVLIGMRDVLQGQESTHGWAIDETALPCRITSCLQRRSIPPAGRHIVILESSKGMNEYSVQPTVDSDRMADIYRITAFHRMP